MVEPAKKPQQVLKFAIEKDLFKKYNIKKKIVYDYLNSKCYIPIWILEAACNINKHDCLIPIQYQYIWFCLNNIKVKRIQHSGRIFNPTVQFVPVYIKTNKKIKNLLNNITSFVKKNKFIELSGFKEHSIFSKWYNRTIPITAILKACQITGDNFVDMIDNCEIGGISSKKGTIIFNKKRNKDLEKILYWIKTEGHVQIYSTNINISQKEPSKEKLQTLKKIFRNTFKLNKKSIGIFYNKAWEGYQLWISSAPLRQILNLVYFIPLGYKTHSIVDEKLNLKNYSNEEKLDILSSFCETEGSFFNRKTHYGKFLSLGFEFKILDKGLRNNCLSLLKELKYKKIYVNYNKKKGEYQIGIYNFDDFLKLCFDLYPYLSEETNKKILNILSIKDLIARIRFGNKKIYLLIKNVREKLKYKKDFIKNIKNKFLLNYNSKYADNWIKNGKIPLSAILYSCAMENESIFKYVPKYTSILLMAQNLIDEERFRSLRCNQNGKL